MKHQCVDARFLFFDGKTRYTVEFTYGISTWFVFADDQHTNALYSYKIDPAKRKTPNRYEAEDILELYLGNN